MNDFHFQQTPKKQKQGSKASEEGQRKTRIEKEMNDYYNGTSKHQRRTTTTATTMRQQQQRNSNKI